MKILVVGGTGPIGATIALKLKNLGHEVTVSSRNKPRQKGPLVEINWVRGNYLEETFKTADLTIYDAVVFAAGSDLRHIPDGQDADSHFLHANGIMVPKFAALAKKAGVKTFIHIGSFYAHILPDIVEFHPYVRSRQLAAKGVTSLSSESFCAMSIDAPFVVGMPMGMKNDMFMAYLAYAKCWHPNVAPFGPAGGTNFISARSLAQAVAGALNNGKGGRTYLVGDENLSFAEFFGYFFKAVGNEIDVPSLDEEHPFLPDIAIIQGRGKFINYEPNKDDLKTLEYDRNDVFPAIQAMADEVEEEIGVITELELGPKAVFEPELYGLACKYGQAVDSGDVNLLESICSKDIVVVGPGFINNGLEEVLAIPHLLQTYFDKTRHVVNQQLVEIDGNRACGQTLCLAEHLLNLGPNSSNREILKWAIRYQDHFIRDGEQWKFSRRELIVDWVELTAAHLPIGTGVLSNER